MIEETGPHQVTAGPHQIDADLHQAKSRGSQHGNPHWNLERREGREGSVRTTHTSKSQSRGKSHVSHAKNDRDMQCEIDELKRELRHARRRCSRLASNLPPKRQMVLVIDGDPELRLARLFPMKRSIAIDVGTKVRLAKAWGTMP